MCAARPHSAPHQALVQAPRHLAKDTWDGQGSRVSKATAVAGWCGRRRGACGKQALHGNKSCSRLQGMLTLANVAVLPSLPCPPATPSSSRCCARLAARSARVSRASSPDPSPSDSPSDSREAGPVGMGERRLGSQLAACGSMGTWVHSQKLRLSGEVAMAWHGISNRLHGMPCHLASSNAASCNTMQCCLRSPQAYGMTWHDMA